MTGDGLRQVGFRRWRDDLPPDADPTLPYTSPGFDPGEGHPTGCAVAASTYRSGRRCRCEGCRAANTHRSRWERSRRWLNRDSADFVHGLSAYTNWGCTCDKCKAHLRRHR